MNGKWNLITFKSISEYESNFETLTENVNRMREQCEKGVCTEALNELDAWLDQSHMYNEMIKAKLNAPQKRGLSTFAYSMLGSLFGVIGAKILEAITGNTNEEKTNEMLENQITVLKLADAQMNELQNVSKNIETMQWDLSYVLLSLLRFQKEQKLILDVISNEQNVLDMEWIKPDELSYQIEMITGHLPKNMKLITMVKLVTMKEIKYWQSTDWQKFEQ